MNAANDNLEDDYFGLCPICHKSDGFMNVRSNHWFYCDEHRKAWCTSSGLFSDWRDESEEVWQQNLETLKSSFEPVDPFYWPVGPRAA